jgi:hypothetical protein
MYWYSYVGDPAVPADKARMEKTSPINLAHRFERPVLVLSRRDGRARAAGTVAIHGGAFGRAG